MELRQLRSFVTLAEELHSGRAAAREYIVQSALSQQVQRLERELGVLLLKRSTHHVSLTAAGAAFLAEAQQILAHPARAAAIASRAAGASGHCGSASSTPAATRCRRSCTRCGARYPRPGHAPNRGQRARAVPAARRGGPSPGIQPVHRRDVPGCWLHPHRARGDRGKHPQPPTGSPRDAACTASPLPASPRSAGPPGGRSPNQPPTTRGQCCGAPPTPPATCRPSSAAHKPCPGDSARSPPQGRRRADRPGYGASSGEILAQGCHHSPFGVKMPFARSLEAAGRSAIDASAKIASTA